MYVDEVIMMYNDRAGEDQDYYYAHDMLYSPVALLNDDGTVAEYYEYDAYGRCSFLDSSFTNLDPQVSAKDNPYLFTGRRLDIMDSGSLKIMYYRARYYNTGTGRFLSRDPIKVDPMLFDVHAFTIAAILGLSDDVGEMSLYEYVQSKPIVMIDPLGLFGSCGPGFWGGIIVPDSYMGISFKGACDGHDDCYAGKGKDGCKSSKNDCDLAFHDDLYKACESQAHPILGGMKNTSGGRGRWIPREEVVRRCKRRADMYAYAVMSMGDKSFNKARKKNKKCCPSSGGSGGGPGSGPGGSPPIFMPIMIL